MRGVIPLKTEGNHPAIPKGGPFWARWPRTDLAPGHVFAVFFWGP